MAEEGEKPSTPAMPLAVPVERNVLRAGARGAAFRAIGAAARGGIPGVVVGGLVAGYLAGFHGWWIVPAGVGYAVNVAWAGYRAHQRALLESPKERD